jgi:hypothetical protein
MDAAQALEVRRVPHSEDLASKGEYVFVPRREPIRSFVTIPKEDLSEPKGFWRSLVALLLDNSRRDVKEVIETVWPEKDTVIIMCPACSSPCGTTVQKIVSVEPLTLDIPITCPYCRTCTFEVKEGKITITS